jgi:hypothetical protein
MMDLTVPTVVEAAREMLASSRPAVEPADA